MTTQVPSISRVAAELEQDGIVILSGLLSPAQLQGMQASFGRMLKHQRWNNVPGYEQTERYRHMVEDVLLLDQGFVDLALHPVVKQTLTEYIGPRFELVEAKGWLSLPTRRDFHGWHGDAWYDQTVIGELQREVKVAIYLTDVKSGGFTYIKGTHGKMHPRSIKDEEVARYPASAIVNVTGPAGTVILFDTSGIHRQSVPILEPRRAVFLNYHDPAIPLQREDIAYYRYHPLLLNAAFLGDLSAEDQRILGLGNKRNYNPGFERKTVHPRFQRSMAGLFRLKLRSAEFSGRVMGRLRRLVSRQG
jgi:hypothetical protein